MKLNILGVEYDLIIDTKKLLEYCEKYDCDEATTQGLFLEYERKIVVRDDLAPEQILHTIFHEIVHAVAEITGHPSLTDSKKGEGLANVLAHGFLGALKSREFRRIISKYLKD